MLTVMKMGLPQIATETEQEFGYNLMQIWINVVHQWGYYINIISSKIGINH